MFLQVFSPRSVHCLTLCMISEYLFLQRNSHLLLISCYMFAILSLLVVTVSISGF